MARRVLKTETVKGGKRARWPYTPDYVQPTASDGRVFVGWRFGNNVHRPPFSDETTNPFGPINSNVEISAVWETLSIYADTNHTLISGDGDEDTDLTKLYYWMQNSSGEKIPDGVVLEEVALDSGMLRINWQDQGAGVVDGKNVETKKALTNDINESRYYRFRAKKDSMTSQTIEIEQVGKDQTILPDFDFLTFRYTWENSDGKDLDSATYVIGTNIMIETGGRVLDNYPVGFNCEGSSGDPDYHGSGGAFHNEISQYIKGAGDNLQSGNESALIKWKEICNRDLISQGINKVYCEIYGNWYNTRDNGNCTVTFQTWKTPSGTGDMKLDRDDNGKTLFTFSPVGDTFLKTTQQITGNVYASSSLNTSNKTTNYSHVATLVYDVRSKNATLTNRMGTRSGRNLRFDTTINNVRENSDGHVSRVCSDWFDYNVLTQVTYTIGSMRLFINGVGHDVALTYTDSELIDRMKWYPRGTTETDWVELLSTTRDASGKVTSITFNIKKQNNTTENLNMDLDINFPTIDGIVPGLTLSIYHRKRE